MIPPTANIPFGTVIKLEPAVPQALPQSSIISTPPATVAPAPTPAPEGAKAAAVPTVLAKAPNASVGSGSTRSGDTRAPFVRQTQKAPPASSVGGGHGKPSAAATPFPSAAPVITAPPAPAPITEASVTAAIEAQKTRIKTLPLKPAPRVMAPSKIIRR